MKTCPKCKATFESTNKFCGYCGTSLVTSDSQIPTTDLRASVPEHYISPTKIVLMTLISNGFYLYYWFYITWKHYQEQSGKTIYPIWHALSLLVPIYSLYKFYSHVKTYQELTSSVYNPNSLRLGIIFFAFLIYKHLLDAWILITANSAGPEPDLSSNPIIVGAILGLIALVVLTMILNLLQKHFNHYWANISSLQSPTQNLASTNISIIEILLSALGVWSWFHTLMMCFHIEYRLHVIEFQANIFRFLEATTTG